jgi:ComF family protein
MPLHPLRLQARGYNQAQLLATHLSRYIKKPMLLNAAQRIRDTPKQSLLSGQSRQQNLSHAFKVSPQSVYGLKVSIVDDVMTSGASLDALARRLKAAGAKTVTGWILARTLPHPY